MVTDWSGPVCRRHRLVCVLGYGLEPGGKQVRALTEGSELASALTLGEDMDSLGRRKIDSRGVGCAGLGARLEIVKDIRENVSLLVVR